jgi:hypothetical protein
MIVPLLSERASARNCCQETMMPMRSLCVKFAWAPVFRSAAAPVGFDSVRAHPLRNAESDVVTNMNVRLTGRFRSSLRQLRSAV